MIAVEEARDRLTSELAALSSQSHDIEHSLKESEAARVLLEEQLAEAKHISKVEQKQRQILEQSVTAGGADVSIGQDTDPANASIDFALHREYFLFFLFVVLCPPSNPYLTPLPQVMNMFSIAGIEGKRGESSRKTKQMPTRE